LSDSDNDEMEFFDALDENEAEFIVHVGKRSGGVGVGRLMNVSVFS
jgi:hypothetical protein